MQLKYILFILLSFVLIDSAIATYCYQESANVSSSCGGLSTGNYTFYTIGATNWSSTSNVTDGDWNSYGYSTAGTIYTTYASVNITYYKPINVKPINSTYPSIWMAKYANETKNLTIPTLCWNYNESYVKFIVNSYYRFAGGSRGIFLYCFNGSDVLIGFGLDTEDTYYKLYEEAMYWEVQDEPTAPTLTNTSRIVVGTNATFSAISTDANGDSLTYYYELYDINTSQALKNYSTENYQMMWNNVSNHILRVRAKAYDGTNYSTATESNYTIQDDIYISPTTVSTSLNTSETYEDSIYISTNNIYEYVNFTINCTSPNANVTCTIANNASIKDVTLNYPDTGDLISFTLQANATATAGTYIGNISVKRLSDNYTHILTWTVNILSTGFGKPILVNASSVYSLSMYSNEIKTQTFYLFNNGTYNITDCIGSFDGTFTGFSFYSFTSGLDVAPNETKSFIATFNSPTIGSFYGYLNIQCNSSATSLNNSISTKPYITLGVNLYVPSSGGGGGGGGTTTPAQLNITTFTVTTDTGSTSPNILMAKDSTRKLAFLVENKLTNQINIQLKCEGDFCSNVRYSKSLLLLQGSQKTNVYADITIPKDFDGETTSFSTVFYDDNGNTRSILTNIKISSIADFIGKLSLFVQEGDEGFWFKVGDINIPKLIFYVLATFFVLGLMGLIEKASKSEAPIPLKIGLTIVVFIGLVFIY